MTFVDILVLYVIYYTNFLVEIHFSYSSKLVYTLSQDILDSHFAYYYSVFINTTGFKQCSFKNLKISKIFLPLAHRVSIHRSKIL